MGCSLHYCNRTKIIEMSKGKIIMWYNQAGLESKAGLDLINWPPIVYWSRHLVSKRTYRTLDSVWWNLHQRFRNTAKVVVSYLFFWAAHGLVNNIFGMHFCLAIFNLCLKHPVSMVFTTCHRSWTWGLWHLSIQFG